MPKVPHLVFSRNIWETALWASFIDKRNKIAYVGTLKIGKLEPGKIVRVLTCFLIIWGIVLGNLPVWADSDFTVQKVILAQDIADRNPEKIFSPPAYCEKDTTGKAAIPIVHASHTSQIVLWTKVESTVTGSIRHTWHHQVNGTWQRVSSVDLGIRPSFGYRTWSLHFLRPGQDEGEWMVVLAPSKEPNRILCITRFSVQ